MDDAFEEHFATLWTTGYRVAYRLAGNRADAEDLTADTLADALRSWSRIREPVGWVVRVTARRTLHLLKSRRPAVPVEDVAQVDDHAQLRAELVDAIRRLPRRQRDVVLLRFLVDMTEPAVAELLGVSTSSVKTHSARALTSLRSAWSVPEGGREHV